MAGSIKGIVIEIGGDTQPLQNAISDVNKKGRELQSELTTINKLLKLDPSNVTLITQKQAVLNEAIANSASKLQTLKEAEQQVQAQFERGEVTEEQYRALQREIESTTLDMRKYESQLKDVNVTSDVTAEKTQKIGNEAEGTGGKVLTFAVAAGSALGNLAANALQGVWNGFQQLGSKILDTTKQLTDHADEIGDLSKKYGITTDQVQEFDYAARIAGTDLESVGGSFSKMTKTMASAQKGTGDQAKAFKELGVSITDANGNLRDQQDVWFDVIDALSKVGNETEADVLASQLFGKSYADMKPIIDQGADGMQNLMQKAKDLNLVMGEDSVQKLGDFHDTMETLTQQSQMVLAPVLTALLPTLQKFSEAIGKKLGDPAVQASLQRVAEKIGDLASKISDKLIDFLSSPQFDKLADSILNLATSAAGGFVTFVEDILPQIIGFFKWCFENQGTVVAAMLAITGGIVAITIAMEANPAGAIILAITAVVVAILWLQANWDQVSVWFMGILQTVSDFFIGIWTGIRDFFVGIWTGITTFFQDAWNGMVNWFVEQAAEYVAFWSGVWTGIQTTFTAVWSAMTSFFTGIMSSISGAFMGIWGGIVNWFQGNLNSIAAFWSGAWTGIENTFIGVWNGIASFFSNIWNSIVSGFKSGINTIINGLNSVTGGINNFIHGINTVSGALGIPAIPNIPAIPQWHAEGAIFTKATLLPSMDGSIHGVGEAGWEAVLPISRLNDIVAGAMKAAGTQANVIVNVYPKDLSKAQSDYLVYRVRRVLGAKI